MKNKFLDINWLKQNHKLIQFFGIGMIQVKLNNIDRLHFYTSQFQSTVEPEEPHSHRYGFTSTILKGRLHQDIYEIDKLGSYEESVKYGHTHWLSLVSCKEGSSGPSPVWPANIKLIGAATYFEGEFYSINSNVFHIVEADEGTITHVQRDKIEKEFAEVLFKAESKPVCPFSVKVSEERLWEVVERLISL